jgi:hypothetical protein
LTVDDWLTAVGVILITAGVAAVHWPSALIFLGVVLGGLGVLRAR